MKNNEFPKVNNKKPKSPIAKWVKDTLTQSSKEEAECGLPGTRFESR